jgi:hypothetical protein
MDKRSKQNLDNELVSELLGFRKINESTFTTVDIRSLNLDIIDKILNKNIIFDYANVLNPKNKKEFRVPIEDLIKSNVFLFDYECKHFNSESASDALHKKLLEKVICDTAFVRRSLNTKMIEYFMKEGIQVLDLSTPRGYLNRITTKIVQSQQSQELTQESSQITSKTLQSSQISQMSEIKTMTYQTAFNPLKRKADFDSEVPSKRQCIDTSSLSPDSQVTNEPMKETVIHTTEVGNVIKHILIPDYSFRKYGFFPPDTIIELKGKEFRTNLFLFFSQVKDISDIDDTDFDKFSGVLSYITGIGDFDKVSIIKEADRFKMNMLEVIRSVKKKCKEEIYYYHSINKDNKILKFLPPKKDPETKNINFGYFFNLKNASDFKIDKGQESIFCHKQILSIANPYFRELFNRFSDNKMELKENEKLEYYTDYIKYLYYRYDIFQGFYQSNQGNQSNQCNQGNQSIDEDKISFFIDLCIKYREEALLKRIKAFVIKNIRKISNNILAKLRMMSIGILREYKDN